MKMIGKLLAGVLILLLVLFAGVTAFLHFYLTDERVKAMVVPAAEKALGRQVSLGDISIGFFKGIVVNDFSVKEAEGEGVPNFISTGAFVLEYDLMPLLQKQVVIKEIRLERSTIRVVRDAKGVFNFESLALFDKKKAEKQAVEKKKEVAPGQLPVALMVQQVRLKQATLVVEDATGQIPATKVIVDSTLTLSLGRDLSALNYQGTLETTIKAVVGELQAGMNLSGKFDEKKLNFQVKVFLAGDTLHLTGQVRDYLQTPAVQLDVQSEALNLDKILAAINTLPKAKGEEKGAPKPQENTAPAAPVGAGIPPGFTAQGKIAIAKLAYHDLAMDSFALTYELNEKILKIQDAGAGLAGGQMQSELTADLGKVDMDYSGRLGLKGVQASEIIASTYAGAADFVSGTMDLGMVFQGAGTAWPDLAENMNAKGSFGFKEGRLKNTQLTQAVAALVGLDELNDISFQELAGDLEIVKGKTAIRAKMSGDDVSAMASGTIGLNGSLDMPVELILSKALSEKLEKKASVAKYIANKEGKSSLRLRLAGSLSDPKPTFDSAAVVEQAKEAVTQRAFEEMGKALNKDKGKEKEGDKQEGENDAVQRIMDDLLGK